MSISGGFEQRVAVGLGASCHSSWVICHSRGARSFSHGAGEGPAPASCDVRSLVMAHDGKPSA